MDKRIGGILVAAGIAVGAIGHAVVAGEPTTEYVTHAWDVRRQIVRLPDGGTNVEYAVEAWFSKKLEDGGMQDMGPGRACSLDQLILGQQEQALIESCAPSK